jgi:anti-sigma-K factor RsiG
VSEPTTDHPANRRVDRIRDPGFLAGLAGLDLEELRRRRDECLAEREYLSLLRRLVQGRAEILRAELEVRGGGHESGPVIERLSVILAGDEPQTTSRGEAMRIGLPEEELLLARRRVERLVADAGISDPAVLDDEALSAVVERLAAEEREVSDARHGVIRVLDALQDELKRRYKDDPTLALR